MPVRVVMIEEDPWWVASDVCRVLEIVRPDAALRGLDDDEKGTHTVSTPGGDQRLSIVNESGLYSMILRSRKAEARAFKRWITSVVIPQIRRTGGYGRAPGILPKAPETFVEALELALAQAKEIEEQKKALIVAEELQQLSDSRIKELEPQAEAGEAYFASGKNLLVRETAKLLGIKEKLLRDLLAQQGYIFRRNTGNGDSSWDARAQHIKSGLFISKLYRFTDASGQERVNYTVMVTPKGVEAIRKRLRTMAVRDNSPAVRRGEHLCVRPPAVEGPA